MSSEARRPSSALLPTSAPAHDLGLGWRVPWKLNSSAPMNSRLCFPGIGWRSAGPTVQGETSQHPLLPSAHGLQQPLPWHQPSESSGQELLGTALWGLPLRHFQTDAQTPTFLSQIKDAPLCCLQHSLQ